jgi:hypothetical protein
MKLDILFHYEVDEQTGEITFIGKEEVTVDTIVAEKKVTKKSTSSTKVDTNPEPIITLDPNKLILTQGAVDLLQVCPDCRVDIKYKKKGSVTVPIIGTDSAFGTKSGNKLTKTNTVSYRGAANDKLSAYGTIFTLEATEDAGIFYLKGDKEPSETKVPDEIINIENDLDMLDDINIEDTELSNFDFTL